MKKKATYDPEIRSHVITVRMNEEEWSAFQSQCKKLGEMSQSDFIRQAVTTAQIKVTVMPVFDNEKPDQMIAERGKSRSNINQIAKHLNIGNPMEARLMKNLNRSLANLDVICTATEKMAGAVMATLKHITSKNADYNAAYRYLVFEHDEKTGRQILDEQGYAVVREKYLLDGLLCAPDTFAMECRKMNKTFKKNQAERDIKTYHYIISYDSKAAALGLTMEQAQEMGMKYARKHLLGHQAIVCTHPDGSNHSGNIHTHIVINSLRAQDTEKLPYKMRRCDTKAGYKHNSTREFLVFAQNGIVKMCLQHGLHQVDFGSLRSGSQIKSTVQVVRDKSVWTREIKSSGQKEKRSSRLSLKQRKNP